MTACKTSKRPLRDREHTIWLLTKIAPKTRLHEQVHLIMRCDHNSKKIINAVMKNEFFYAENENFELLNVILRKAKWVLLLKHQQNRSHITIFLVKKGKNALEVHELCFWHNPNAHSNTLRIILGSFKCIFSISTLISVLRMESHWHKFTSQWNEKKNCHKQKTNKSAVEYIHVCNTG